MLKLFFLAVALITSCATENKSDNPKEAPIAEIFPKDNPAGESAMVGPADAIVAMPSQLASSKSAYKTPRDVNVRSAPDTKNSKVVRTIKKGEKITCLDEKSKGWCRVGEGEFVALKMLQPL